MIKSLVPHTSEVSTTNLAKAVENSPQDETMGRFEDALRQIMQVSKEDLKKIQAEEEAEKADKPKRGPKPKR